MGQGSMSGLAQILAEELMIDWEQVGVEQALASKISYLTGGSGAIKGRFAPLRTAGAAARELLVAAAMLATGVPFLPGTSTVSEVLAVLEAGLTEMKFFPAEAAGGAPYLKSVAGPLPQARLAGLLPPLGAAVPALTLDLLAQVVLQLQSQARFADPTKPDRPPMPPDDPVISATRPSSLKRSRILVI